MNAYVYFFHLSCTRGHQVRVHPAAENDVDLEIRAARGSVHDDGICSQRYASPNLMLSIGVPGGRSLV